jgi:hypothetical protein
MSIIYKGPNYFASGRIFWLIWPKIFAWSWQHWPAVAFSLVPRVANLGEFSPKNANSGIFGGFGELGDF